MSTKEKVAALRAEFPRLPAVHIAQHLGITRQYVALILKELGLPTFFRAHLPGDYSPAENRRRLEALSRRYEGICQYCGIKCESGSPDVGRQPSIDRIVPHVKGGQYVDENEILACRRCNCTKGNKTADEARHRIALQYLGWPNMSREAVKWLKTQGIDISAYETFRFKFER
jgi:hypothetical protein